MKIIPLKTFQMKISDQSFSHTRLFHLTSGNNDLIKNGYIDFTFDYENLANESPQLLVPTWTRAEIDDDCCVYDSVVEYLLCDITDQKKYSGNPNFPFSFRATLIELIPASEVKIIPDDIMESDDEPGLEDWGYINKSFKLN
ncbi:MAG: hypothetical protein DAHOPDDO_00856 [Ignavibacteriaceae bacterium]|nr:hypothetical protein [Ignavibacteriaceae bacterium]